MRVFGGFGRQSLWLKLENGHTKIVGYPGHVESESKRSERQAEVHATFGT